jgi:serine phosphatase RsbU (regulator of sigma subunit)
MLAEATFTSDAIDLEPGSLLAVFSDGIPEARRDDEFFEDERLMALIEECAGQSDLEGIGHTIIDRVDHFVDGRARSDDITLLLVKRDA